MQNEHLSVIILDDNTFFDYIVNDEKIFSYNHPIGMKHIEAHSLNNIAESKLADGMIHCLSQISLYERIPTMIKLSAYKYSPWFKKVLENISYAQFYTNGKTVRVILNDINLSSPSYARHTKTPQSFKI